MNQEQPEKIQELQMLEQNIRSYAQQRQSFLAQQMEVESALTELDKSEDSYKIIGNIMVKSSKDNLKKELEEKKSLLDVRLKSIDKQEKSLKEKFDNLQKVVLDSMKENKGSEQ